MSAYSLDPTLVATIKSFVDMLKQHPTMLESPDLGFLRDYLASIGAKVPKVSEESNSAGAAGDSTGDSKPATGGETGSAKTEEVVDEEMDSEPEEPFPELPQDGVIEEEADDPSQDMGKPDAEPSEEDMDKSNELKMEAVGFFSEGNYQECVNKYTEAIKLNGQSAALFAKRGQAYLRLEKPNACIKDCTRALEINPDSAVAYKFRGRAHRLLGHWEESAADLRQACKIDLDEQTDEWLKEVQPHARKVEEWRLRKKRRDEEREIKQRRARAQQRAQAHANAHAHKDDKSESSPDDFFGSIPGLSEVMNDPEVKELFADPEVAAAFGEIGQNPANILKYQSNPKVAKLLQLLQKKMAGGMGGGMGGMGGMPGGMGGMGGMPGGFPGMGGMGGMPGGMGGMGGMPGGFPGMGGMPGFGGAGAPPPPQSTPKPPPADDLD